MGGGLQAQLSRDPSRRTLLRSSRSPWVLRTPRALRRARTSPTLDPRPASSARERRWLRSPSNAAVRRRTARRLGARAPLVAEFKHRDRETRVDGGSCGAVGPPGCFAPPEPRVAHEAHRLSITSYARRLGARAPLVAESKQRCCETSPRPSARRESAVGRGVQATRPRDPSRRRLLRSTRSPWVLRTPRAPRRARSSPNLDHVVRRSARRESAVGRGLHAKRCCETSIRPSARRESAVGPETRVSATPSQVRAGPCYAGARILLIGTSASASISSFTGIDALMSFLAAAISLRRFTPITPATRSPLSRNAANCLDSIEPR